MESNRREEQVGKAKLKVLFLDVDGVINTRTTYSNLEEGNMFPLDPLLAFRVGKITLEVPDVQVVLSSSWRHSKEAIAQIEKRVVPIFDITPIETNDGYGHHRGSEIGSWLARHPEVEKYAIVDDDADMLPWQLPNFFQTNFQEGLTEEIMNKIINHLNEIDPEERRKEQALDLIKSRVNVKEVIFGDTHGEKVLLDLEITPELKEEGEVRELIHKIQEFRKTEGMDPNDKNKTLLVTASKEVISLLSKNFRSIKNATLFEWIKTKEGTFSLEVIKKY